MFISPSSAIITLYRILCTIFNPVDSTTYYLGPGPAAPSTTVTRRQGFFNRTGKIKAVWVNWYATTVAGSGEDITITLEVNGGTVATLPLVTSMTAYKGFGVEGLDVAVDAMSYYELKIVCPAWVTNPTGVCVSGNVWVEE